jgi:UDP-N-acetylmuramyl pentapeptide phosphotransferase/UDP-N-acetylglucosamine-1-phosphate transferase
MGGVVIAVLLLTSTYFATNQRIESRSKAGYFAVVGVCALLYLLIGVLL